MQEAASVVSVADAFDASDVFDLHLSLGFQQTWKTATITRETHSTDSVFSSGGFTASNLNVAKYSETTSRLHTRADIGLFRDVALFVRLPVILANDRALDGIDGSQATQATATAGFPGEQLFELPFRAPTRSGIEYLALGLTFEPMSQWRDATKPNWVIGVEGRFNVSEPLHACNENPGSGQVRCADPSDINRNGETDATGDIPLEGENISGGRNPGVSRGTTGLAFHTYMSKRIKYIEPYAGISGLFEFQNSDSDFGLTDAQGAIVNHPPIEGSLLLGLAIYPWEALDLFQRVEIDLRFKGTYRSQGRDYSELFDALGSSSAVSLRDPKFSEFKDDETRAGIQSIVDTDSSKLYTTGITSVQPHGLYTVSTGVSWFAGEYLRFNLGGAFTFVQGHLITFDQPCNPNFSVGPGEQGPCQKRSTSDRDSFIPSGIPNANFREVLNIPGRRFKVNDSMAVDAWLNATVMF